MSQHNNRPQSVAEPQVYLTAGWWTLRMLEPAIQQLTAAARQSTVDIVGKSDGWNVIEAEHFDEA